MSGGTWEYVMGVQKDASGNVQVASSGFSTSSLPDSKYYELYDYQAEDGVGYTRYHLGDATREVLKDTSSQGNKAWWSDYSYNIYSSYLGFVVVVLTTTALLLACSTLMLPVLAAGRAFRSAPL